jgi:hypothetical protein
MVEAMIVLTESITRFFLRGERPLQVLADQLHRIGRELGGGAVAVPRVKGVLRALNAANTVLRRPLRLALMGEANSGKSALTNLLLGSSIIPALQLPNTRIPTLIRYADNPSVAALLTTGHTLPLTAGAAPRADMIRIEVGLPIAHLRACEIMDFPGFADPWLGYGSMDVAKHRIDGSIWCTFSTQAWKESERAAWRMLPARMRRHALLVVTNKDLLRDEQAQKVTARLEKVAMADFRGIALASSPKALRALNGEGAVADSAQWHASGGAAFLEATGQLLLHIRQERLKRVQSFANGIAGKALNHLNALESS